MFNNQIELDNYNKENIISWNNLAGIVESSFPLDFVLDISRIQKMDSILDFGCGDGRFLKFLFDKGFYDITGADTSERMCELARLRDVAQNVFKITYSKVDEMQEQQFDAIFLIGVLSSIIYTSQRKALISRIQNYCHSFSKLIIADFGMSNSPLYLNRYKTWKLEESTFQTEDGIWIHHFQIEELTKLIEPYFNIECVKSIEVKTIHNRQIPGHIIYARNKI
jgi:SAM-dependent methyltransferase